MEEWRRLDQAVQEEWRAVMSSDKQQQPQQQQGKGEGGQREGLVVPPYMAYDPAGQRPPRPFQKPPGLLDTVSARHSS